MMKAPVEMPPASRGESLEAARFSGACRRWYEAALLAVSLVGCDAPFKPADPGSRHATSSEHSDNGLSDVRTLHRVKVVHFPQIHDGDSRVFDIARRGATNDPKEPIKRLQFELAKRLLEEVKADPGTAIFVEGFAEEQTHESFITGVVDSLLRQVAEQKGDRDNELYVIKPELLNGGSSEAKGCREAQEILRILAPAIRLEVQDGVQVSVVDIAKANRIVLELHLKAHGLGGGFPERFEDASDSLQQALLAGGAKLLMQAGYIDRIHPLESRATWDAFHQLTRRPKRIEGQGSVKSTALEPKLVAEMEMMPSILKRREDDAGNLVVKFLQSKQGSGVDKVIIVYGAAHQLEDDFTSRGLTYTRDPVLDEIVDRTRGMIRGTLKREVDIK